MGSGGPSEESPRGGLGTWAQSKLSAHVSTDSFAVKRPHCEEPPQGVEQNEHRDFNGKECKGSLCDVLRNN